MEQAQTLVAEARKSAGLSIRELARLANVSVTTISRVEAGEMDPTVGMLQRILAAAGEDLEMTTKPASRTRPSLAALADAHVASAAGERPDWTALRSFIDYLAVHPDETAAAIDPQPHTKSRLMRALLAGMAEKLADDNGLHRPGWTWTAPKMKPDWETPGTPRMRAERRASTPRQLLDRGLVIDESSFWRDPNSVGI
jgi:transcriptional regulator with XRE-family HTH domain